MDTLAPPVVAVVVAHDPGSWFEETLASLASQDYAELSILVLDAASAEDVAPRVAAVLPTAFVRRFEENRGFGATIDEVSAMVDGAAYYLLCHDDVALFPDTVHLLVEEAFRSNAGVVAPKVVSWDDPERLIHVGMAVDKGGSVVERVHSYEIDHGQHDAVRDVFVAPGGATLVRADLFDELGGFDPAIVAMGEDLDLCWRAQVVGARIIVAPDARVRHLEELASGSRSIDGALAGLDGEGPPAQPVTLQELQRRHELLAVLKCYGTFNLLRVLPQVLVLAVGEVIVAEVAGDRVRARAVVRAWRWNLRRLSVIRGQRKVLKGHRRLADKEIRQLQIAGSARLSTYGRRVFQYGFHGAYADELAAADYAAEDDVAADDGAEDGAAATSPDRDRSTVAPARGRVNGRIRALTWTAAGLIVLLGSRGVLTGRLPEVGQFVPFPGWASTLSQFFTGWHPSGVGTTAPASPALALAGLAGTVLLGAMGLAQKVLVFACIPLGAWGAVRLMRPFGSQRASLIAGLAYLAMALPYDAIALGRWGALVVYAGSPWVLARLFRATGTAPYRRAGPEEPLPSRRWRLLRSGRHPTVGAVVALGLVEAVLVSFVPAAAVVVLLAGIALVVSSCIGGDWRSTRRALALAAGSTLVAALICLPWLIGVLSAGRGAVSVFGVPVAASQAASWGALLRFAAGPIGASPLAWGFVVAAVVPLVLARGERFRWAVRFWSIALVFWVVAWVIDRGWTASLAIDPLVLLAPAAMAVAASIGLGIAAFEEDLRAATFGWRQVVVVVATIMVVLGSLPTLVSAFPGRWDLPVNDFSQSVSWMRSKSTAGAFRVLWLGDPRSLNLGSWAAGDGLAYATSEDGSPDARWLWNAAGPGPAAGLGSSVDQAISDRTNQLGRMLAPAGVRYVVLLTSLAPEISGEQSPQEYPVPPGLTSALSAQLDLDPVISGSGITVYENTAWIPERTAVPGGAAVANGPSDPGPLGGAPGSSILPGAVPVLPGGTASRSYRGAVPRGTVLTALAPAGRWSLVGADGRTAIERPSFGWAGSYRVSSGVSTLRFGGGILPLLIGLYSVLVWLVAVAVLLDRQLGLGGWRLRRRRRRLVTGEDDTTDGPVAPEPAQGGTEPVTVEARP
jgi:GT2 family glycosyltransferase